MVVKAMLRCKGIETFMLIVGRPEQKTTAVFDSLTAARVSLRVDSAKYFLRIRGVMLSIALFSLKKQVASDVAVFLP